MAPDSGNAAVNWQSFVNQIIQGGIDVARLKHLGVPTPDSRVPDQADLYYGDKAKQPAAAVPAWLWPAVIAGVVVLGVVAVFRMK